MASTFLDHCLLSCTCFPSALSAWVQVLCMFKEKLWSRRWPLCQLRWDAGVRTDALNEFMQAATALMYSGLGMTLLPVAVGFAPKLLL